MDRIDAESLERLDFAHGARGPQLNDVGSADTGEDQERGEQRAEFPNDDEDHDRAQVVDGADPGEPGDGLADHEEAEGGGHEQEHG